MPISFPPRKRNRAAAPHFVWSAPLRQRAIGNTSRRSLVLCGRLCCIRQWLRQKHIYPTPVHPCVFLSYSQVRVNALKGSRTLSRSTVDLLAAAAAGPTASASNAGSPRAAGGGDGNGIAEVDATAIFDRNLRGDSSTGRHRGRTATTGRHTRIQHGLAATTGTVYNGGSAATAIPRGAATTDGSLLQEVDYGTAASRETMMRSAARTSDAEAAAAAESNAAAAATAAVEAAAELARQRDPLWKYRQQVSDEKDRAYSLFQSFSCVPGRDVPSHIWAHLEIRRVSFTTGRSFFFF